MKDLKLRLQENIKKGQLGCWLWQGYVTDRGYGRLPWKGKPTGAHRLSHIAFKGEIPKGMEVDHLCRVRNCINPDHLEAVPKKTNIMRGISFGAVNARKDACPNGHPYTEDNTYRKPSGHRICKVCRRTSYNAMYARRSKEILARQHAREAKIAALEAE